MTRRISDLFFNQKSEKWSLKESEKSSRDRIPTNDQMYLSAHNNGGLPGSNGHLTGSSCALNQSMTYLQDICRSRRPTCDTAIPLRQPLAANYREISSNGPSFSDSSSSFTGKIYLIFASLMTIFIFTELTCKLCV